MCKQCIAHLVSWFHRPREPELACKRVMNEKQGRNWNASYHSVPLIHLFLIKSMPLKCAGIVTRLSNQWTVTCIIDHKGVLITIQHIDTCTDKLTQFYQKHWHWTFLSERPAKEINSCFCVVFWNTSHGNTDSYCRSQSVVGLLFEQTVQMTKTTVYVFVMVFTHFMHSFVFY